MKVKRAVCLVTLIAAWQAACRRVEGPHPPGVPLAPAPAAVHGAGESGPPGQDAPIKALVGGTVVHTRLARPGAPTHLDDATVLIRRNRIERVGPSAQVKVPAGAQIIDARGRYIIPGLVDGHIHFFQSGGLYTRPDGLDLRHRVPYAEEIRRIRENMDDLLRRYLRCGITTVVDLGGPFWNFEVRDQARRTRAAPRVFVSGPLIASYTPQALATRDPAIIRVTTREQALALVRRQIAHRPDLIKIWYVVSKTDALDPEAFFPIARSVAAEAHRHRIPVFIHATELQTAKQALRAGADVLVHSITDRKVDDELLQLARKRRAMLIPTLWVFSSYAAVYSKQLELMDVEHRWGNPQVIGTLFDMHELEERELGQRQRTLQAEMKPIRTSEVILENLRTLQQAGVPLAAGTDAGNVGVLHGPALFHDLMLMARAGLSPHQVLVAATLNGARLVGRHRELGSVEPGRLADLVVLSADPLADVLNTTRIEWVLKDGHLFDPGRLLPRRPRDLVQVQLNAYNARQLEPFLSVYDPRVEVLDFPDRLLFKGIAAMRQRYAAFFKKATRLHARLVGRMETGRFVIDQESVVTGIPGQESLEAMAIYELADDAIRRVWFIR